MDVASTTFKGDVAELMAAAELVRRGYMVARPLTNGAAYDLLVDDGDAIRKIQVKRISRSENGAIRVNLYASKHHRGRKNILYHGRVDAVIGVDCSSGAMFLIEGDLLLSAVIYLRDSKAKNNQIARVRLASDFDLGVRFPPKPMVGATGIEPVTLRV